jgi:hypothetical protein
MFAHGPGFFIHYKFSMNYYVVGAKKLEPLTFSV